MDKPAAFPEMRVAAKRVLDGLSQFWQWWSGELSAMLPDSISDRFQSRGRYMIIELNPQQCSIRYGSRGSMEQLASFHLTAERLSLSGLPDYSAQAAKADETIVLLPPEMLLSKTLTLPLATAANLTNVLKFEMDRYTPFSAEQVYFGHRIESRDKATQTITVSLHLIPRKQLDPLLEQLLGQGLRASVVAPAAEASRELYSMNLLPPELQAGSAKSRLLPRVKLALSLLVVLLLLILPLQYQEQKLASLQAAQEAPRLQAEKAQKINEQVKQLSESRGFLQEKKAETVSRLMLLDELTALLPDHTWINNLRLNGDELQLQGESDEASSLISLLEEAEFLQNVRFASPVTLNARTDKERFSIVARVGRKVQ